MIAVTNEAPTSAGAGTAEDAFAVKLASPAGDFRHEVVKHGDGTETRAIETPDGTTTFSTDVDLTETGTHPHGDFKRIRRPGAELSLETDLPSRLGSLDARYFVNGGAQPDDLRQAVDFTQTTKWNDATTTTTTSGNTITTTTPGHRTITTTTDDQGRPVSIQLPGLPAITISGYGPAGPTSISQGGRTVQLGYDNGFVNSITDPLGRVVSMPRDDGGRVESQDVFSLQSFDFDYDANGNVKKVTSPQAAGYDEDLDYTKTDLVKSFELPAGQTTVEYGADRKAETGLAPQGTLTFDDDGRLTGIGEISYEYDDDDYVTVITGAAGDGGALRAVFSSQLSVVRGRRQRSDDNGQRRLSVSSLEGVIAEADSRAGGGRVCERRVSGSESVETVRRPGQSGVRGRAAAAQRGKVRAGRPIASGGGIGSGEHCGRTGPPAQERIPPTPFDRERQSGRGRYIVGGGIRAGIHRSARAGESCGGVDRGAPDAARLAQSLARLTSCQFSVVRCQCRASPCVLLPTSQLATDNGQLRTAPKAPTTFVSTPLSSARTFQSGEQVRVVVGARQTDGGALQAVATLWVMDDSGDERCTIRKDWLLDGGAMLPSGSDSRGIGDYTGPGQCTGVELQTGDRVVAEIGYRCTTDEEVEGAVSRGGQGPALFEDGDPTDHACGQPGYVELDGDWAFASDTPTPCEADAEQTVLTTRRTSITINASNQATAASIVDPDGTPREYEYSYDTQGALDTKTDITDPDPANHLVTDYDYDAFGNLRHVSLPDGRTIDYLIDAANRRVGRVLKDDTGAVIDEKRWLYQSALRPVAELDGSNNVTSFFVYADKPNVPEYMVKGGVKYRIITDHLGSVRLVVNSTTGVIAQRIDYDEWGNVTQDTNPGFQPFGFAGGLYDQIAGLVRFGARDLDPSLGRWNAADLVGFGGREANLYGYSGNDPINLTDPTGLEWISTEFLGGYATGVGKGAVGVIAGLAVVGVSLAAITAGGVAAPLVGALALSGVIAVGGVSAAHHVGEVATVLTENGAGYSDAELGELFGTSVVGAVNVGGLYTGVEFGYPKHRVAPWGNRTNDAYGVFPHYHRPHPDPKKPGHALYDQSYKRHRPMEPRQSDRWFGDRF